jgi:hypothetical protein
MQKTILHMPSIYMANCLKGTTLLWLHQAMRRQHVLEQHDSLFRDNMKIVYNAHLIELTCDANILATTIIY